MAECQLPQKWYKYCQNKAHFAQIWGRKLLLCKSRSKESLLLVMRKRSRNPLHSDGGITALLNWILAKVLLPINYLKVLKFLGGGKPSSVGLVLGIGCTDLGLSDYSCSSNLTYSYDFCCALMPFLLHNCLRLGTLASEGTDL